MRKIVIEVETDDIDSIEEIKRDIENELSCCSTSFDFDTLEVYDKADTPQTETQMKTQNSNLPFEPQTDEPPMDEYYKDHDEFYDCNRYVITNDEGDKAYNCIGCTQTDCGWK